MFSMPDHLYNILHRGKNYSSTCTTCSIMLHVNCKIVVFMNFQVLTMAKTDTKVKTRS